MSPSIKPRITCFLFLNALLLPCRDDPKRAPLRFGTVILDGAVTAGTGAAAYLANEVGNDARAGVGGCELRGLVRRPGRFTAAQHQAAGAAGRHRCNS